MIALRCAALAALATAPLAAQKRVDLTGAPVAAITEPFSHLVGIRELPGDRAITADLRELKVLLVDFGRDEVTSLARKGNGPGEFQFPMNVLAAPNHETWISDPTVNKVHAVSPAGIFTGTLATPEPSMTGGIPSLMVARGVDRDGRLYYQTRRVDPQARRFADSIEIQRWNRTTKTMETVARLPSPASAGPASQGSAARTGVTPFAPQEYWLPLPDGRIAFARPSPYRVDVIGANGTAIPGTAQPYAPIRVTAADREAYRSTMGSGAMAMPRVRGTGGSGSAPTIADEAFPATKPPFTGQHAVLVTPEGEIWIHRTRAATDPVPIYDIWDGAGKVIGKATLRPNSRVIGFGAGTAYVERRDPKDDLLYLEKYAR